HPAAPVRTVLHDRGERDGIGAVHRPRDLRRQQRVARVRGALRCGCTLFVGNQGSEALKRIERNGATGRTSAPQRCVLVVDDEVDILELIELTLLRMGLDVDRAMSVADAGEKLANGRHYDLCLTDMRLPDGTGLEIVEQIQKAELDLPVAV